MSADGPNVVCIGCGARTSLYKPFCDDCAYFYVTEVGHMPFCVLCHAGYPVEHGMHKTPAGGHAGPCTAQQPQGGSDDVV